MQSIKEKASSHASTHPVACYVSYGGTVFDEDTPMDNFVAGGKYVTEIIKAVINQPKNDYLILQELREAIYQLEK